MTDEIQVEDEMIRAWKNGVKQYKPVFCDKVMEAEGGVVETSLKNLREIVKGGLQVSEIWMGPNANALVRFASGENYLATGFKIGGKAVEVKGLAKFCAEAGLGTVEHIYDYLVSLPADYEGALDLPVPADAPDAQPGDFKVVK
ncbi:MAG: hypothetical protein DWQ35_23115 [Planctomycetota bacterium]|nr:MAG: hypothetical protein DWQ35_23115 [Planctomycetota bacterium]REK23297.1 MAG: hypothetical protein DWQ42_15555 [Planctomycetota bacterium]REK39219.1 MAG: hypothetical protein DWQ46_18205 [Planctomycetota bacterium]